MPALIANGVPRAPVTWPAAVWRADGLDTPVQRTWPSGFAALDGALPGGGWPAHAMTEILLPHDASAEWRLLAPVLAHLAAEGRETLLVGPPQPPHPAGLQMMGLPARQLVWLRADTVAERLWCTEQLLKARSGAAVLAWLPQARPAQLRRLQVLAAGCDTPVFLMRPEAAAQTASAAPLRLRVGVASAWGLSVEILKRRGPPLAQPVPLQVLPAGLAAVWPPRLQGQLRPMPENERVVVRPVPEPAWH